MEKDILDIMLAHHALIETLFTVLEDNIKKGTGDEKQMANQFSWEMEKHWFVEEKNIFVFAPYLGEEISEMAFKLAKEHEIIRTMLKEMEDDLSSGRDYDIPKLHQILVEHRKTEEKYFYPKMDKVLTDEQKRTIAGKINEIKINSSF